VDKEAEQYYDNYFSLFRQQGWKQLMNDFGQNAGQINSVEATKDADDMQFRKGQLNVIGYLLNMESIMNTNYEQASEEPETEEDD
jgi:hypothetical protein|tara:strand:- start:1299 stop:1553 length:255 start_codon:yes stop_codon:yes gene_type:complete